MLMNNQEIFLDGKVDNLVYITLVEIVPGQSGICELEVIQQAKFLSFFDRGGAIAYYARHRVLSENFVLSS